MIDMISTGYLAGYPETVFKDRFLEIKNWADDDEEREEFIAFRLIEYLEITHPDGKGADGFDEDDFKKYVEAVSGTVL